MRSVSRFIELFLMVFALILEIALLVIIWDVWQPHTLMVLSKIVLIVIIVNGMLYVYNEYRNVVKSESYGGHDDVPTPKPIGTTDSNPRIKMRNTHGSQQ